MDVFRETKEKEYAKAYYLKNRDVRRAVQRQYYRQNREDLLKKQKEHYWQNHGKVREYQNEYSRRNRIATLKHYGGCCQCCGETTLEFLGIDHVDNGYGNPADRTTGMGSAFYRWLKKHKYPSGFQVLCHDCNMAKGFYGSCPHQQMKTPIDIFLTLSL